MEWWKLAPQSELQIKHGTILAARNIHTNFWNYGK